MKIWFHSHVIAYRKEIILYCSPKFEMAVHWFVLNIEYSTNINRFDVDKIKYSVKITWYYKFLVEKLYNYRQIMNKQVLQFVLEIIISKHPYMGNIFKV